MKALLKTVVMVLMVLTLLPITGWAQGDASAAERALFDSANRERTARGLPPLKWDPQLAAAARQHALFMAKQNDISHQFPGEPDPPSRIRQAGAHFTAAAENVAEGPSAEIIHDGWMKSPGHRANLLDPEMNSLGVAVVERNGQLFAVQDFSKALVEVSLQGQEQEVAAQLKTQGLHALVGTAGARRACETGHAETAGHHSVFLLRYSSHDLRKLPDALEQEIRAEHYTEAAVGACSAGRDASFSQYQIAVLLYEQ